MTQTRRHSALEAAADVAIGHVISIAAQLVIFPMFGIRIALGENLGIGLCFTVVSLVRSFALRRAFNRLALPQ